MFRASENTIGRIESNLQEGWLVIRMSLFASLDLQPPRHCQALTTIG